MNFGKCVKLHCPAVSDLIIGSTFKDPFNCTPNEEFATVPVVKFKTTLNIYIPASVIVNVSVPLKVIPYP
ncbi:hypothetical protein [Bacillus mycoides]|uniref:hypothetical protein n=1 Tax=Bacillus mycoides TaxID=1405 RepID=UPI0021121184|nr:hypothetical protein [Bacillus mycoides]MCQ6529844.1 hypothetical protein [Bacillus mycoides]